MTKAYHVLGHCILESWEALAKAGQDTIVMETPAAIERAVRDLRLLVGFLDTALAVHVKLVAAYGVNPELSKETNDEMAGPFVESRPLPGQAIIFAWPAKEFESVGALATWVKRELEISMSAIMKEARVSSTRGLTLSKTKAAVEAIVKRRDQARQSDGKPA